MGHASGSITAVRPDRGDSAQTAALLRKVRSALRGFDVRLPPDFNDETPLISSGILDSLALYNLLIWIEEETGRNVDPATTDIGSAWNTVRDIAAFMLSAEQIAPGGPRQPNSDDTIAAVADRRSIEFVPCSLKHRDGVAEFQTALWSPSRELNARYFDWKYRRAPYSEDTRVYLAMRDGRIVGMRSMYGSLWEHGTPRTLTRALVADDLLVRADLRGRGVVSALMNHAFEDSARSGVPYLLSLSASPTTVMNSLAMGWTRVGPVGPIGRLRIHERWRRALVDTAARMHFVSRSVQRSGEPSPTNWSWTSWLPVAANRNPFERLDLAGVAVRARNGVIVDISDRPQPEKLADLVERLGHDGRIRHVRDASYMAWRFANPLHEYRFLTVGGNRLAGYLILKRAIAPLSGDNRVMIVDLEAEDAAKRRALLDVAVRCGAFPYLYAWSVAYSEEDLQHMRTLGFTAVDPQLTAHNCPCWLVRPIQTADDSTRHRNDAQFLDPANWDMRLGYSMNG